MSEPCTKDEIEAFRPWIETNTSVSFPLDHSRWLATVDALHTRLAAAEARAEGAVAAPR